MLFVSVALMAAGWNAMAQDQRKPISDRKPVSERKAVGERNSQGKRKPANKKKRIAVDSLLKPPTDTLMVN